MADIVLSVVSGTYQRLPLLQNMVQSARDSLCAVVDGDFVRSGIPYEIVLVDGGSTDGTIEWAKAQPDVRLIEQGELLGAIKAFNEGAFAAVGTYVVLANDDITFTDDTLITAVAYMQEHPEVGCGCFFQDRPPQGPWHIEEMPAIFRDRQVSAPYGQVAIYPKWLGDEVGWWGDWGGLTFGGDNELSAQIYERGYRVVPIECCCIHDTKHEDDLRKRNETGQRDGHIWGRKWRQRRGMSGPVIAEKPHKPNPIRREFRTLYLPIYEQGHDIQYRQKKGLRDALARFGMVVEFDYMGIAARQGTEYMRAYLVDVIDSWGPDLILTQIHNSDPKHFTPDVLWNIKQRYEDVKFVNWNGDYNRGLFEQENLELAAQFDLQLVVTTKVAEPYRRARIKWEYWQIGWEEAPAGIPDATTPRHDVVFLANGYSRDRVHLARMLRELPQDVGIYGSWPPAIKADGYSLYNFDEGSKVYKNAKVSIGDDQWNAPGFVSNRLFQAMHAGGALYLQKRVPGLEKLLGLRDGVHFVLWDQLDDLKNKIEKFTDPQNELLRAQIAENGRQEMIAHHSFDARVQQLMGWL